MSDKSQFEPGINAFLEAVNLLFHSNDKDLKVKANKFLVEFEAKAESWDIAYQVLLKDNLPEEVYYNALNILKNKIKYYFGNYSENPENIEKLLSFFLNNIDKFKKAKHYILINYCDCIGKAFLFTGDNFNKLLKQFTNKLSVQNNDIESLISLLLIFNFICETNFDKRMVIDNTSKQNFSENIKLISPDVFHFIVFMINKLNSIDDNNLRNFISNNILETLNNYLYIEFDESVILKFNNEYMPIINFIFQLDEENLDKHCECICSLLNLPLQENNMRPLAQIIFSKIAGYKDIFYKTIETLDNEQSSFYIDVFTSMVANNFEELLQENRLDFFQIIVDLTRKSPANKILTIVDFFVYFNNYLYEKNYEIEEIMKNLKNLFIQLIMNFMSLTKFDDEIFSKLNKHRTKSLQNDDEYNQTMDFRSAAKELLEDFLKNYDFNFIFNDIIFPEFKKIIDKIKENQNLITNWCKLENLLYNFSCICEYINPDDPSFENVKILFYTIFDIPKEYIQIIRTVTDIIDNCSKYLSSDKDLLFKGFNYLVNGLDNELITKYCSVSAGNLLKKNREIMSELREGLFNLYESKLKNKMLDNSKYYNIVEGLVLVITYSTKEKAQQNYNIIKASLVKIMTQWVLFIQQAKAVLEKNNILSPEENNKVNELLIILKAISNSAFEGLLDAHKKIMYEILLELYPSVIYIMKKLSTDSNIVENSIQLIKIYMRGLVDDFIQFIPEYINCIINGYKLSPISSYLYAFEILVTAFPNRKEQELRNLLSQTFYELCKITLTNYIKKEFDLNIFVQIGEDFFGMLYRTMKASPRIILESKILEDLIKVSLNYITTYQIDIAKNIMIFFNYFIKFKNSNYFKKMAKEDKMEADSCQKIIQAQIEKFSSLLCQKILQIYINNSIEQIIEAANELFETFISCEKNLVIQGMNIYLKDCPNDILTNKEKKQLINLISDTSFNDDEFKNFWNTFISRCISKQKRALGQNK